MIGEPLGPFMVSIAAKGSSPGSWILANFFRRKRSSLLIWQRAKPRLSRMSGTTGRVVESAAITIGGWTEHC